MGDAIAHAMPWPGQACAPDIARAARQAKAR
jgi:hypothetical protein